MRPQVIPNDLNWPQKQPLPSSNEFSGFELQNYWKRVVSKVKISVKMDRNSQKKGIDHSMPFWHLDIVNKWLLITFVALCFARVPAFKSLAKIYTTELAPLSRWYICLYKDNVAFIYNINKKISRLKPPASIARLRISTKYLEVIR